MPMYLFVFFFNDTATTEIYTLSLHDALPISPSLVRDCRIPAAPSAVADHNPPRPLDHRPGPRNGHQTLQCWPPDRKSTRLNSSHSQISYAVFCLKKKNDTSPSPPTALITPHL